MNSIPVFGKIISHASYVDRPGSYGFILNTNKQIAIVQTGLGFFLPGGGQEPAETPFSALEREVREELGYRVTQATPITQAIQYHWSSYYHSHFRKIGTFFKVEAVPIDPHPGFQNEHSLIWWSPDQAHRKLSQEFQRWAVRTVFLDSSRVAF